MEKVLTPKEQALELFLHYWDTDFGGRGFVGTVEAKNEAHFVVSKIEMYRKQIEEQLDEDLYHVNGVEEYWKEVNIEIRKIDTHKLQSENNKWAND
jgi:hypothetical protein